MNNLDKKYHELLREILTEGFSKEDRTGTGTISTFGTTLKFNMLEGFPLLTTKKMYWKGIVHELIWFLKGQTNIKYLVDNDVNIWNGDAYKKYVSRIQETFKPGNEAILNNMHQYGFLKGTGEPFSKKEFIAKIKNGPYFDKLFTHHFGELGPVYGKQWRNWENINSNKKEISFDQIKEVIEKLKNNPDDRGILVSAWNVGELNEMTLRPCHYAFQLWTRELTIKERIEIYAKRHPDWAMIGTDEFMNSHNIPKRSISLLWNQRSVDTFLGLPFNIASYGLLLSMIGKVVNMDPEHLIFSGGDTHIYNNHKEMVYEQLENKGFDLPKISFLKENYSSLEEFNFEDIILEGYNSDDEIKAPLSN